jgi:glycine/serine hydroxymethyltransferase
MMEADMDVIAGFIDRAINGRADAATLHEIAGEVKEFCAGFPIWE